MQASQIASFTQQLLAQRASLLAQIAQQRGGVKSRAEAAAEHSAEVGDSSAEVAVERELAITLGERELAELQTLDAALQRIEAGTYGQCTGCDAPIAVARLEASPEAARCIACQDHHERAHPAG